MNSNELSIQDRSAQIIQQAWRSHVDRQVFQYYKELLNFRASGDPKQLLKSINPRERELLDRAAGCVVRYRLGGESFPPRLYYKIFTHRNVEDLCANSPKDYTHSSAKMKPAIVANNRITDYGNVKSDENVWYKRFENNGWRPVTERIFYSLAVDSVAGIQGKGTENFNNNRLARREDRERRRKQKRIKWLQKLYSVGQPKPSESSTFQPEDIEAEELLKWSSALDFEEYLKSWGQYATSESS